MSNSKIQILIVAGVLIVFCFASSLVNVFYSVNNRKLKSSVDMMSEENAILRAEYLSTISASNLTNEAAQLNMQYASGQDHVRKNAVFKSNKTWEQRFGSWLTKIQRNSAAVGGY